MDNSLRDLQDECRRAAADFLAMDGWDNSKSRVTAIVDQMVAGSSPSTATLSWLIDQISRLPVRSEPARRLNNLVQTAGAFHTRKKFLASSHLDGEARPKNAAEVPISITRNPGSPGR